jgi:predicted enzyme related to lactoylglutathione lyase
MRVRSAAPVLAVDDVGAAMSFYGALLGLRAEPFPSDPPYVFCILASESVELMLQKTNGHARESGRWHVYLRVEGVRELARRAAELGIEIVEPLGKREYGDTEIAIRDPNGYVIVLSELEG